MNKMARNPKTFLKHHSATIFTCVSGIGVIVTTVMAVKATPKALELLEQAEEEKGEELTKAEAVKVAGPVYIPAIVMGVTTIACIFSANVMNKHRQAALMSAYTLVNNSYSEYKSKLKELYGQEAHNKIVDSIAVEKAKETNIRCESLCEYCDLSVEDNLGEPKLFYDEYSMRYFESTIEQVITAEYHLNRNYTLRGYAVLNELYEFLGLEETEYGDMVGWAPNDDGMYWIDFNHRKTTLDNGTLECYIIEMPFGPTAEALDDWT